MISQPKQYKNYRFYTIKEANAEMNRGPPNKERTIMHHMLNPIVEFINKSGVKEYQDFIMIFKDSRFRMRDVQNFIFEFRDWINSQNKQIKWISNRGLSKSNFGEKNLILNRLAIEYPNELMIFVRSYMQNCSPEILKCESFVQDFQKKIQLLLNNIIC